MDESELLITLEKDNNSYRLKYLRSQLNPHFLFNTLNSIYSLSMQKSEKTPEVVVKLADLMRYLIYECNEEKVPLNKEIEFIRNYIEIEKIRYKADVRFTVEGETDAVMVEPFLFISFIENGFKHAFRQCLYECIYLYNIKVQPETDRIIHVVNNTSIDLETQAKKSMVQASGTAKIFLKWYIQPPMRLILYKQTKKKTERVNYALKHAKKRLEVFIPILIHLM